MKKISISIAQSASIKADINANVAHHKKFVEMAGINGARLIIFPELSLTGYEPELAKYLIISINDERLIALKRLAQEFDIIIVAGTPVLSSNRELNIGALCLFPDNSVKTYTKHYLHPGEEKFFAPGTENCTLSLSTEKVALAICADITHPDHALNAANRGASIYASGVLITEEGYKADTQLLKQYAIEHKMLVSMANHSTATGGWEPAGKSAIWDDTGKLLAKIEGKEEAVIIALKKNDNWSCKVININ